MAKLGEVTIGDYLALDDPPPADFMITNPPFRLTDRFIEKALTHISGPILILQQSKWAQSKRRIASLRKAGLSHVLHLTSRPRFEFDHEPKRPQNFEFSWFVFQRDFAGQITFDWLTDDAVKAAA